MGPPRPFTVGDGGLAMKSKSEMYTQSFYTARHMNR